MTYKQITDPDENGFYLDLDTLDNHLVVWNHDEDDGEIYHYGEWSAVEVYKQLKTYFEGPEGCQLSKGFDEYRHYGENNPPVGESK